MSAPNGGSRSSRAWRAGSGAAALAALLGAAVVLALGSAPAVGQEEPAGSDTASVGGEAADVDGEMPVYRRQVFEYPTGGRRNPFAPVDAGVEEGPRFQNLRVTGVLHSPAVGSVAIVVDESTGRRYRVRDGQTIGEARVLEIRRTEVAFAVSGAGETRREILQVERRQREDEG